MTGLVARLLSAQGVMRFLARLRTGGWFALCIISAAQLAGCGGGSSGVPTGAPVITPTPDVANGQPQSTNWATFQHDMSRTGVAPSSGITAANVGSLALSWSYKLPNGVEGSPIIANGVVYVVSEYGDVVALRASDGALIWQTQLDWGGVPGHVPATPALYDGILFIGTYLWAPSPMFALDPLTGNVLWEQTLPGSIRAAPVLVAGTLYEAVADGDPPACYPGAIFGLNEQTGAFSTTWLTNPALSQDGGGIWSPLSTDGENLYFGTGNTCDPGGQWTTTDDPVTTDAIVSTTLSGTTRYAIQTGPPWYDEDVASGTLLSGPAAYTMTKHGSLFAVNRANGTVVWSRNLNPLETYGLFATPAMADGVVIVGAGYKTLTPPYGGMLYGVSAADGSVIWVHDSTNLIYSSAAIASNVAFINIDNSIAAINPTTGTTLWSYDTVGTFTGSPAIGAGLVVSADLSGRVYAFSLSPSDSTNARLSRSLVPRAPALGASAYLHKPPPECFLRVPPRPAVR